MSFISPPFQTRSRRLTQILSDLVQKIAENSMLRGALFAFAIRVVSAGLAFFSQALLARWMGAYEFGLFAYVWVWVIVLGTLAPLGMNSAVLRFVPQYKEQGDTKRLRGFLSAGSWISFAAGCLVAVTGAAFLYIAGDAVDSVYLVPFYLAFICLPLFSLTDFQEGVGRAHSWIGAALAPPYIIRPVLLLAFMVLAIFAGAEPNVKTAMLAAIGASWVVGALQFFLLRARLKDAHGRGQRQYDLPVWLKVSMPLLLVEGFSLLLLNTDIMVMSRYLSPVEVAHYFAAVKVTGLIGFVYYAVVAASAQRFAKYGAAGDHEKLQDLVRQSARWTFWPSLAASVCILALGWPLLWLFGEGFTAAWPVMFILAGGILVRASVGPLDYVLNMLGEQNITAIILGCAAALNVGLNFVAIPSFGLLGAAAATSASLVMVSVLLKIAANNRLGVQVSPLKAQGGAILKCSGKTQYFVEEIDDFSRMRDIQIEWQKLSDTALAPNSVYSPDMALAAFDNLAGGDRKLKALCVWHRDGADETNNQLVGFLPYLGNSQICAWHHIYSFCSVPLICARHNEAALGSMLSWFARKGRICQLRILPTDGAFARVLDQVAKKNDGLYRVFETYERAVLVPRNHGAGVLQKTLSRQRRKTLNRQQRRLGEMGDVAFESFGAGDDIELWAQMFLELEARGWKGAKKTAMLCSPADTRFMQQMLSSAAKGGRLRFYRLTLAGKPIAMSMAMQSGRGLFFFKMAYDETYRSHSPGMIMFARITEKLGSECDLDFADSCSTPDHPLLDHMWPERRMVGHVLIAPGGSVFGRIKFALTGFKIQAAITLRAMAKSLYHHIAARRA